MLKKILPLFICFTVATLLIVGGGVALFYFNDGSTNDNQEVEIEVEQELQLGTITLKYKKDTTTWADESDGNFTNSVFFDNDSVYFIRSDNPTCERNFFIDYVSNAKDEGVTVSLVCEITIYDGDGRGVTVGTLQNDNEIEEKYYYSESLVDYFEPSKAVFEASGQRSEFKKTSESDDGKSVTYTCTIFDDVNADDFANLASFLLKLEYKDFQINESGEVHHGNMSPYNYVMSLDGYEKFAENITKAKENSSVTISFKLAAEKGGAEQ